MKIKVFCLNANDKLEFTKEELENLLNEVYNDGYRDGSFTKTRTYTYPTIALKSSDSTTGTTTYHDSANLNDLAFTSTNTGIPEYCKIDESGQVHINIQDLSHD